MSWARLRVQPSARRGGTARLRKDEQGFGLIESVIAIGVAAVGLLAIAGLMAAGANLQQRSRDGGRSGMAAIQMLEQLRLLPRTDARVQIGGSLTADIAGYTALVDVPPAGRIRVRWVVQAGPAGSRDITVRAIPAQPQARTSEVRSLVWRPAAR
jgi:Tfp pilus assembly protein PilV